LVQKSLETIPPFCQVTIDLCEVFGRAIVHELRLLDVWFYWLWFYSLPARWAVASLYALLGCEDAAAECAKIAENSRLLIQFLASYYPDGIEYVQPQVQQGKTEEETKPQYETGAPRFQRS